MDALQELKNTWTLFDIAKDKELIQEVEKVSADLLVTRGEQMLLTLFTIGWDRYTQTEREKRVRGLRTLVGGPKRFVKVFEPLRNKALDTLKGK